MDRVRRALVETAGLLIAAWWLARSIVELVRTVRGWSRRARIVAVGRSGLVERPTLYAHPRSP